MSWIAALGFGAFLLAGPVALAAPPTSTDDDVARPNPSAVVGRLANGLRYTILQHPSHNKESLRLFEEAGSRDETDAESGVAHFVEHMAFVGSRRFPGDRLAKDFADAGMALGRDQNASTTYLGTTYALDIPEVNGAKLDLSFRWLGDVADGLNFSPTIVDRERQVILQEYVLGVGPAKDAAYLTEVFATPDARAARRRPIGDERAIKSVSAPTLERFHSLWYRPERTFVVAVGDEPVEAVRRRILSTFGSWRSSMPAQPHPTDGTIDPLRPSDVLALTEPKLPGGVSVCRSGDIDPEQPESVASDRPMLADAIWGSALARRFQASIQSPTPPVAQATTVRFKVYKAGAETCFKATPLNDDWRSALKILTDEARRMSAHGISQTEFDFAKTQITSNLVLAVATEPTRDAGAIAASILYNDREGETFDTATEDRRVKIRALSGLNVEEVGAAFRRRWDDAAPPLLTVISPNAVARTEVLAAWTADLAAPVPGVWSDRAPAVWRYDGFGSPGTVTHREVLLDPDFVRLTFQNGVVVNFKHTNFARNTVETRIRFGAGQQEIEPGHVFEATFGAGLLLAGGLGQDTAEDLTDICKGHVCSVGLGLARTSFELGGATRTDDLRLELQILTAFLTDPGFSDRVDKRLPSAVHALYRQMDSNPGLMAHQALAKALPEPHVVDLPTEAAALAMTSGMFRKDLETPLRTDALEVTLVGDVDEDQATRSIAETLGALGPRLRRDHVRPDAVHGRYAETAPPRIVAPHRGPREQAFVLMVWPLYVWDKSRVHEGRVMALLRGALQDEITSKVRRELGKTYTPGVALSVDEGGDQGDLTVSVQTTPADAEAVIGAVKRIAADFATGGVTSDKLERVRKPILAGAAQQRTYNGWWVGILDGSFARPEQLEWTRTRDHDIATIPLGEVNAEARRWLSEAPMIVVSMPETATPGSSDPPNDGRP